MSSCLYHLCFLFLGDPRSYTHLRSPGLWYCEPWTPSNFIAGVKNQFYLVISVLTSETPKLGTFVFLFVLGPGPLT